MKKVTFIFSFFILLILSITGQSIRCAYCGQGIERSYISYEGKVYHDNCYRSFIQPRCATCSQPIDGKFVMANGEQYHENCYNQSVALRCDLCNEIINGTYTSDHWGNNYHASHEGEESKCDYCERYISASLTRGGSKYSDGRIICKLCELTSVNSLTKAKTIFESVRSSLSNLGIKIDYNPIKLRIVNRDELRRIAAERGKVSDPRGFAEYSYMKSGNRIESKDFTIYILSGMPQKEFEAVFAHELMHVWQYINSSDKMDTQLREGSAEYAAYLHMSKNNDDKSRFVIHKISNNRDETYGGGFRRVKKIVEKKGFYYLIEHLRKSNNFPPGY